MWQSPGGLASCVSNHDLLIFLLWKGTCLVADSRWLVSDQTLPLDRGWILRLQGSEATTLWFSGDRPVMED